MSIKENLLAVKQTIPNSVTLVAVSKKTENEVKKDPENVDNKEKK